MSRNVDDEQQTSQKKLGHKQTTLYFPIMTVNFAKKMFKMESTGLTVADRISFWEQF
jgi:hypothetical protein